MPVPSQYSEAIFAADMVSWLADLAPVLGWSGGSPQVQQAVTTALLKYGTTDITTVTAPADIDALQALGRRAIWRAAVDGLASKYDFRDSDASFSRSQMQEMALEALARAERDVAETAGIGLSVGRLTLDFLEPASQWR